MNFDDALRYLPNNERQAKCYARRSGVKQSNGGYRHGNCDSQRVFVLIYVESLVDRFCSVRNHTNNEIKKVKRKYFTENLKSNISNPQKTWKLINELNSRHPNKVKNIPEIKVREQTITEPSEIAEELNLHFSSIGGRLAFEIPSSNVEPEFYLEPTKTIFSL